MIGKNAKTLVDVAEELDKEEDTNENKVDNLNMEDYAHDYIFSTQPQGMETQI